MVILKQCHKVTDNWMNFFLCKNSGLTKALRCLVLHGLHDGEIESTNEGQRIIFQQFFEYFVTSMMVYSFTTLYDDVQYKKESIILLHIHTRQKAFLI